jgi:hypothetical protein
MFTLIQLQHPIRAAVMLGLMGLMSASLTARSQATTPASVAEITDTIQGQLDQIASAGGNTKAINGVSDGLKGTTGQVGRNTLKANYCYVANSNPPVEVVVFTDGSYIYSSSPSYFTPLATACPTANQILLDVTAVTGGSYQWTAFYIVHN